MIKVAVADIASLEVDAVVNAANSTLLGGGGVDGAIHRAAGPGLLEECRGLGGCPTGEARMTSGHQLPAKFIVHAVGPVWHGGGRDEARLLEQCYRHCFRLALEQNLKSIALPAISTGAFGFPKQQAAGIAARVMREFESQLEEIVACCFSEEDAEIYREALAEERE